MPPEAAAATHADPTTTMLAALKRRISIWERMIAANSVPPETKQKAADEVLYLYSAMTELSDKVEPAPTAPPPPAPEAPTPTNGNGAHASGPVAKPTTQDATGSSSTPLSAEDLAEFETIRQRKGSPGPKKRA